MNHTQVALSSRQYFTEGFIGCKLHGCEYVAGISRISTLADYVRHNSYASHLPVIFKPQIGGVYSEIFVILGDKIPILRHKHSGVWNKPSKCFDDCMNIIILLIAADDCVKRNCTCPMSISIISVQWMQITGGANR